MFGHGKAHRVPVKNTVPAYPASPVRREERIFLHWTLPVVFTLLLTVGAIAQMSPYLQKFVDPLPKPGVMAPVSVSPGFKAYVVNMYQVKQKLHRDLPATTVWTYNGTYPGATFEARQGETTRVTWTCSLPTTHLLPVDMTLPDTMHGDPEVRVTPHRHGGLQNADIDGPPDAWFTPGFTETGPEYVTNVYNYPNNQPPATLWYHDHTGGLTRLNVYAGLAGFYLIRNDFEDNLNLPKGNYEIPLAIQDRTFNMDGSLFYPSNGDWRYPVWVKHFHGDTAVVNGKVWPYLEVEPRKYRIRLLNGCNARRLSLKFSPGVTAYQIGGDAGLLPFPVKSSGVKLDPGERADFVVDFKNYKGKNILLVNTETGDGHDLYEIMQFRVKNVTVADNSSIPSVLQPLEHISELDAVAVRDVTMEVKRDSKGEVAFLLGGKFRHETATEVARKNTVEVWRIVNLLGETHPIHPHLAHIQVLDRQPCNVEAYGKALAEYRAGRAPAPVLENFLKGEPQGPRRGENGLKDTVQADGASVTRILVRYGEYTGNTVWHCHILEHEDNDMMRPLIVTD